MIPKKIVGDAISLIEQAKIATEAARDAAQEKFDERSDSWKESDKGQEMEAKIESLGEISDTLDGAIENLNEAISD